jgi:hypothetical protein
VSPSREAGVERRTLTPPAAPPLVCVATTKRRCVNERRGN